MGSAPVWFVEPDVSRGQRTSVPRAFVDREMSAGDRETLRKLDVLERRI